MTPRHRPVAATLIAALLVSTIACSDEDTPSRSKAGETTTTTVASNDAGTESDPSAATAPSPPPDADLDPGNVAADAWSAPGEPSPLQLGTGVPEPEYPSGKDGTVATLADGQLDLLVQQVDEEHGQVLANVVILVVGDDAKTRARADGKLRPDEELSGNYYVSDPNPKLRGISLADQVVLRGEAKRQQVGESTGRAAVSAALIDRLAEAPGIPYRATVSGGAIVELVIPDVDDATIPGP